MITIVKYKIECKRRYIFYYYSILYLATPRITGGGTQNTTGMVLLTGQGT
jgi:hypothetical protein